MIRLPGIAARVPLAVVLVLGTAVASVSLSYTTSPSQTLGVAAPPIVFLAGADSGNSNYVSGFSVSPNATHFTVSLRGVPEATTTIGELFKVKNVDSLPHEVAIASTQVSNPKILAYQIAFLDGATLVATLDFLAGSPTASLGTMIPGATYAAKVTIQLDSGAGNDNVASVARSLTLTLTA